MSVGEVRRVTSTADAADFLGWLGERRPILAIDTETGGLEWWRQPLRLVPFGDTQAAWVLSYRDWRGVIEQALRRYERPVVFHNASFDCHMLEMNGLPTPAMHLTHDTAVMDCIVEPGESHKLKVAADRNLGPGASDDQAALEAVKKANGWDWATIPEDHPLYVQYAGSDTILTARLAEHLWPRVQPYAEAYYLEMAAQSILYRIERKGMAVDRPYAQALRDEWAQELAGVSDEINGYGVENPNSRAQIGTVLKADGWEPRAWTKTGKPKLDAEVLEAMDHPLAALLTRQSRLTKWISAYMDTLLDDTGIGGMVHPSFKVMGARTGRMSSPQQQYPRGPIIRNAILPRPGEGLWSLDYDTMEMRMFAHFSQDPGLMQAAIDGFDMHRFGAAMANDIPMEDVTPEQRQTAKHSVSFGKLYGAGDDKVAAKAGVSVAEIQRFNERYEAKFPGVVSFMDEIVNVGRQRQRTEGEPYIITWGGRRVSQNDGRMYALLNYIIQGSCADLFKRKLVDLDAAGYADNIVLLVHDECLFSLPPEMDDEVPKIVAIMEEREAFSVPFTVGAAGPLVRWGDQEK